MAGLAVTAEMRRGTEAVLRGALERVPTAAQPRREVPTPSESDLAALAFQLEQEIYPAGVAAGATEPNIGEYVAVVQKVRQVLPVQVGMFPDDVAGEMYLAQRLDALALVRLGLAPPPPPEPREQSRRLFAALLCETAEYHGERDLVRAAALDIERACFNATIAACRASPEPPQRSWTTPVFVEMYSARCGTIAAALDPRSSVCRAYGARLVARLRAGELQAADLGEMDSQQLCPESVAVEKAEIEKRSAQKVVRKESTMFRCPHCQQRRCNYRVAQLRAADEAPDYLCECLNPDCRREFTGRT